MENLSSDPILEHVHSGRDVCIEGCDASKRLEAVAAGLDERFNVVRVAAPAGGLSLSGLIALLSGCEKFDDQDDGALEAGFRRLSGADAPGQRTVLLLDATQGVQRPVLRYLQQIGRTASDLTFVIAGFPQLASYLAAPDMARLRNRLETVVNAGGPVEAAAAVTATPLPAEWTLEVDRRAAGRTGRRARRVGFIWAASAMAASVAVGAWLGRTTVMRPDATIATTARTVGAPRHLGPEAPREAELTPAPVPASTVPAPLVAAALVPLPPVAISPPEAIATERTASAAVEERLAPAPLVAAAMAPPPVAMSAPEAAAAEATTSAAVEERLATLPRARAAEAPRLAGMHSRASAGSRMARKPLLAPAPEVERFAEGERPVPHYGAEQAALWRTRAGFGRVPIGSGGDPIDQRPSNEGGYIGTYAMGPNGARVFRYGP